MTAETLRSVVRNFTSLSKEETDALQSLTSDAPYCQVFHMLMARSSKDLGRPDQKDRLHRAAVYATDRAVLKLVMTTPMRTRVALRETSGTTLRALRETSGTESSGAVPPVAASKPPQETPVVPTTSATAKPKKKTDTVSPAQSQSIPPSPPAYRKQEITLEGEALRADLAKELSKLQVLKHEFEESYEKFIHSGPFVSPQKAKSSDRIPLRPLREETTLRETSGTTLRETSGTTLRETPATTPQDTPAMKPDGPPPAPTLPPVEGEPLIEEIKTSKRKPKLVSPKVAEQGEIIDNFIKVAPTLPRAKPSEPSVDLSEDSVNYGDNIVSETLVEILLKQGKKAKAIEMLKKLIWKFPQKKAYFAAQIEALKG